MKGFTVQHWMNFRPQEDSWGAYSYPKIFAAADGITRDPRGMPVISHRNHLKMIEFFLKYPRPSPAKYAADAFCRVFQEVVLDFYDKNNNAVLEGFREANKEIKKLNEEHNPHPDYLENDFWACVAVGAVREKGVLSYGFIADCGIAVFDGSGLTFRTPNEGPNSKGSIDDDVLRKYQTTFAFPEGRKIIRSLYRNNPQEPLAYGALTGEEAALQYVRTGQVEVEPLRDTAVVYTDGLEEVVFSQEFSKTLKCRDHLLLEPYCKKKVKTEGTLVTDLFDFSPLFGFVKTLKKYQKS